MPSQPAFYVVLTDSFIYENRVYGKGELIPRERGQLDYALGIGLIKFYEPEEANGAPQKESLGSRLGGLLSRKARRVN